MSKSSSPVNVFEYQDYRQFLRDWYTAAKKTRASHSFRTFSKNAGFLSPNFFKLVMDGDRNLTEESLVKFMVGLKLNKQEQDFFRNLVFFTQAKDHPEKDFYYQKLLQSKKFSQLRVLEKEQYEYYSTWYHTAVRELVVSKGFDGTAVWLAKKLFPPITPAQAEKSIELLEKLGFIKRTANRRWQQASSIVTTGPEVASTAVLNYHKHLLDLTKELLEKVPAASRDVSTMTLGIVRDRFPELKKKIWEFRQEILKLVSVDTNPEEVVQLNIQFIPLTYSKQESNQGGNQS